MSKDHLERRMYRKSPGRQYGYDYDPLRSQNGNEPKSSSGESASRSGTLLAHRPDPRRTRQLMRRSIIASKRPNEEEESEQLRFSDQDDYAAEEELVGSRAGRRRVLQRGRYPSNDYPSSASRSHHPSRSERDESLNLPPTSALLLPDADDDDIYSTDNWRALAALDQDLAGVEPLDQRVRYRHDYDDDDYDDEPSVHPSRSAALRQPVEKLTRRLEPELPERIYPEEDDKYDYDYEYDGDRSSVRPARVKSSGKKKKLTRRRLLLGAGVVAVAGVGVAAVELPKVTPQVVNDVSSNAAKQVEDAFNRGVTQGVDQARKEFISSMESIEGFTLDGAITAARLTRVAYDVFVSPIIKFGADIAGDVLSGMFNAFKTAHSLLAGINQDNATLNAIQSVLESWVNQVNQMPKQLDAITQSDLDGAQAYLNALKTKVAAEKAQLNATATPAPKAVPTATKK